MHVEALHGSVVLKVGERFTAPDLECVVQILGRFAPFTHLIVDFTDAHEFPDLSFPPFFEAIRHIGGTHIAFRGLTAHQLRLLRYLGLLQSPAAATGR